MSNIKQIKDKNKAYIHGFYNREDDTFNISLRNGDKKTMHKIRNPKVPIYVTKKIPDYIKEYVSIDECNKIYVPYRNKEYHIARELNMLSYAEDIRNKKYHRDTIYLSRNLYGADIRIEDYYIMKFLDSLGGYPELENYYNAYLDMEWDIRDGSKTHENHPIFLSSTYQSYTNTMYLYYLVNSEYGKQDEMFDTEKQATRFKENMLVEFRNNKVLSQKVIDHYMKVIPEMKIEIVRCDQEIDVIEGSWQRAMGGDKPADFLHIFNASADVSMAEYRAELLKGTANGVFCDKSIGKYYNMQYEGKNGKKVQKRKKFHPKWLRMNFESDSMCKIVDDMVMHYCIRVGKEYDRYSLDATCENNLGFGKTDYSHVTDSLTDLHVLDFPLAAEYNMRDTFLMDILNMVCADIVSTNIKKYIDACEIDKVFVPMHAVTALFNYRALKKGFVYCNEVNKHVMKNTESFYKAMDDKLLLTLYNAVQSSETILGGYCTDPSLFVAESTKAIGYGTNNKMHGTSGDNDMKSYYPCTRVSSNISRESMYGRIDKAKFSNEEIATAIINKSYHEMGTLFGLPSLTELYTASTNKIIYPKKQSGIEKRYEVKNEVLRKVLSKLLRHNSQPKDEEAGYINMNGKFMVNNDEVTMMRYHGMLVEYTFYRNGIPVPLASELIGEDTSCLMKSGGKGILVNCRSSEKFYMTPSVGPIEGGSVVCTGRIDDIGELLKQKESNYRLRLNNGDIVGLNYRSLVPATLSNEISYEVIDKDSVRFLRVEAKVDIDKTSYLIIRQTMRYLQKDINISTNGNNSDES